MTTARVSCFENANLRIYIAEFLDYGDLSALELASSAWSATTHHSYKILSKSHQYHYMIFKKSLLYNTNKRLCAKVFNSRNSLSDKLLLIGGSFGSPYTDTCVFNDGSEGISGTISRSLNPPIKIGSTAIVQDQHEDALFLGGWNDVAEATLDDIYMLSSRHSTPTMHWQKVGKLPRPLCYAAAERNIQGDIVVIGGGSSPHRGAESYSTCLLRRAGEHINTWSAGVVPDLHGVRCGHSAVTTFNDSIVVAGGYAGGTDYLNTVELLDPSFERWTNLAPMSVPRSGMAMVLGPDGAIYAAGGSPDGTIGHKSLERLDLRVGKWERLSDMHRGRGYTAGVVSTWGTFYVGGGLADLQPQPGFEAYDFRTGRWNQLELPPPFDHAAARAQHEALQNEVTSAQQVLQDIDLNGNETAKAAQRQLVEELEAALREHMHSVYSGYKAQLHVATAEQFKRCCHVFLRVR